MSGFKTTGISYLVRSSSGTYYWQAKIGGQSRRGSLKTKSQSVAKSRLHRAIERAQAKHESAGAFGGAQGLNTVADWADVWLRRQGERVGIKESTLEDYRKRVATLKRSPVMDLEVKDLSEEVLRKWWREECQRWKPATVNHKLRVLKLVLADAWRELGMGESPAESLERKPVRKRLRVLPSGEDVQALANSIRRQGKFHSQEVAALVEFLAYSGCRPAEVRAMIGDDIDGDWLSVRGGSEGTKNREERLVPINPKLKVVIDREGLREKEGRLFSIDSPGRALSNACKRLEMRNVRPYDLRHFFITSCVESGVDVATVAKWAGHKDGGVLILRTYTHTRQDHSLNEAKRLRFD